MARPRGHTSDPVLATYFLFHDADLAAFRHGLATLQRTDLSNVYAETPSQDPARLPSTYLLPRDDRTLRPSWMIHTARQRLGVEPIKLAGGHNCYTAHPEHVAATIAAQLSPLHQQQTATEHDSTTHTVAKLAKNLILRHQPMGPNYSGRQFPLT